MSTEYKLDNILIVAKELVENIINNNIRVVFLDGGLGSGKTTLVKAICNHIGVKDNVNSPTFTIMNEYVVDKKSKYYKYIKNIYHIDTYRLESQKEIEILNLHSIIKDDNLVFIEWPDKIKDISPDMLIKLKGVKDEYTREFEVIIFNLQK